MAAETVLAVVEGGGAGVGVGGVGAGVGMGVLGGGVVGVVDGVDVVL